MTNTAQARSSDMHFSVYRLPEPSKEFYSTLSRELVPCCGYEYGTPDFHSGLDLMNRRANLQLDAIDSRAFCLMLTGLSQARRFGGDPHIAPILGENSAAHSLHSIVLATEIFRQAGLLSPERQDPSTLKIRALVNLGLLTHDMGEILGELSSVAQRAADPNLQEEPDIERGIFRVALTEAFRAVSSEHYETASFYAFLRDMRDDAGIGRSRDASETKAALLETVRRYSERQQAHPIPFEMQGRVERYLAVYDTAELKENATSREDLFIGNAVKVIEHLQGTRHLLRHVCIDPDDRRPQLLFPDSAPNSPQGHWVKPLVQEMVPLRLVSNYRLSRNLAYMEKELPKLFETARSDAERALATRLRDATYLTMAEFLSVARPVFDRAIQEENSFLRDLLKEFAGDDLPERRSHTLSIIRKFLAHQLKEDLASSESQDRSSSSGGELPRFVARQDLVTRYREAVRVGYEPTTETPLGALCALPEGFNTHRDRISGSLNDLSMPAPE